MIFCPNKNLPEWKELVNRLGDEDLAYFEWNRKYGDFNQAPVKTIKNGVPELFDSNPELANQVYEALGFTKKNEVEIIENKIITAGKTWLINEFEKNSEISKFLKSRDKKKFEDFGVESIYDMPKDDIIYYLSLVAQEFAGGVGQIFTFNSIDDIYNKNNPRSSYDEALKVRNFFKEKFNIPKDLVEGIDSKKEESILNLLGYRVSEKPVNGKYRVTLKRDFTSFYDEFSTKEEAKAKANELNKNILSERLGTQITPQQKQQALQQYSQYLDTIFPESKVKDIVYHGTKGKKFDKFISSETGEFGRGVYFGNYQTALENTDKLDDFTLEPITGFDKNKIIPAVINTQNIYKRDLGGNGIRNEYVVEPEQIHILGSQKDIKGFKEFADKVNETDVALEHQDSFTMEELSAMMYENTEIDFNTEELIDSPIDKLYNAYSETFSENQISKEKLEELLSKGVPVNSIEEWTKSCLIGGGKGVPKAKDGMSFNFTPGGTWKLIKDLQGYPTHEKGGVDLYIGKNGVNLARGESSIMAEKGLVMPNQTPKTDDNLVVSELYTQKTGKPWSSAKAEGLTTGSYDDNIKLRQRLIEGEFDNKEIPPKFIPNISNPEASVYDQAINFNDAFKMAREQLGPNQIFDYQGRKYGTNLKGEVFEPSQETLAQHNMNVPKVKKRLQDQNEKVVSPFTSKNTTKLEPEYKNWEEKKEDIADFNKMDEADKIISYQSKNNTGKNYVIIDKKKGLLHIYDGKSNEPIYTSAVDIGAATENKDDQTVTKYIDRNNDGKITDADKPFKADYSKGNKSTGAGIYYISNIGEYQGMPSLNMMNERQYENFLRTGEVENVGTSFHRGYIKDDETRVSNGCIRCNRTTLNNLVRNLENSSQVFILPEEEGNNFVVENGKLLFKGNINAPKNEKGEFINPETNQVSNVPYYKDFNGDWQKGQGLNTSPTTLNYVPIKLELNEELFRENVFQTFDFNDEKELNTTRSFISALENNKQRVMRAVKISGDVYNDIAKMAFGIYGTESNFGDTHSAIGNLGRAVRKVISPKSSSSPDVVSKATTYGAGNENNSVGYTQIRWSQLNNREKEVLRTLNINSNKDFLNPEKAAIATVAILGVRYQEQLTPEQRKNIDVYLPKTWNNRSNYASRVKSNSQYLNVYELN